MMSIIDNVKDLYNRLFGSGETNQNNLFRHRTSPAKVNLTFDDTVNVDLTRGLWHNSVPGFKLGASLCYNPIAVPLSFMGFPHFDLDDWDAVNEDFWREKFDFYNKKYINAKKNIQLMCHRDGTILIWPWFDSNVNYVRWKFIKPEWVSKVTTDPDTEEVTGIVTSINYLFQSLNGKLYNYTEERTYTKQIITISRTGSVPPELNALDVRRNPIGILPIVFGNKREPGDFEGYSDYERMIPLVKSYSKVIKKAVINEAKHGPKLAQQVANANNWLNTNSHLGDPSDLDIAAVDFILNIDGEKSEFVVPQGLNNNAFALTEVLYHLIIEQSSIPEICWGLKTKGNHATPQEQMAILRSFVKGKIDQANPPYIALQDATNRLEALANTQKVPEGLKVTWNDLNTLTEIEKATIWKDRVEGLTKLLANNAIDLQSVHSELYELADGRITSDYDEFKKQIMEYGTLKAWSEQEYIVIQETSGDFARNARNSAASGEKGKNGYKAKA